MARRIAAGIFGFDYGLWRAKLPELLGAYDMSDASRVCGLIFEDNLRTKGRHLARADTYCG